jgi:AcrR family transcriptional regulator
MKQEGGLRERKKDATRTALSNAALRLAVERGLDEVRIEDIAAEAGVSPRTFNNYFSSKEEAVVGGGSERVALFRAALRARPAEEPLWTALSEAVAELFPKEPDRAWVSKIRFVKSSPALRAERLKSDVAVEHALAGAIAERTGSDAVKDLHPRLAAAMVVATVRTAMDFWLDVTPKTPLRSVLRGALQEVAKGLPGDKNSSRRR